MSQNLNTVAVIGIDIGKNSFHVVGHDQRGAIMLHQRWSRSQVLAASMSSIAQSCRDYRRTECRSSRKYETRYALLTGG